MSQSKKDDTVLGVVIIGYVVSAIIFTIWNWDFIEGNGTFVAGAHFWGLIIIIGLCGFIAKSYNLKEDDLFNEINLDFDGKLDRASFWILYLALFLIVDVLFLSIDYYTFGSEPYYDYSALLSFNMIGTYFTLLPMLAIGSRRLHDTGRSGWWQLLYLTIIGIAVLIVFWAQETKQENNNAKANFDSDSFAKEIERLSELKNKGAITEEEYSKAKSKILT